MAQGAPDDPLVTTARTVMLWDPCGLLAAYGNGTLVLHLSVKRNGKLLLKLASPTKILFRDKIRAPVLTKGDDSGVKYAKKKKAKKRKKKKKKKPPVDRFDWSQYLKAEIKKVQAIAASTETDDAVQATKKRNRKRKRHKRRNNKKKKSRKSNGGKSKERSKKRNSSSSGQDTLKRGSSNSSSDSANTYKSDMFLTPKRDKNLVTKLSNKEETFYGTLPSMTVAPAYCSNKDATKLTSHVLMPPAVRPSDLRSPMAWEKRRHQLLNSKQGSVKVQAVSLSNPFVSVRGYLFADTNNEKKLEETLKAGAFVYSTSGGQKERKMMMWKQRYFRNRSNSSTIGTNSNLSKESGSSQSSSGSSASPTPLALAQEEVTYLQFDVNHSDGHHVTKTHKVVSDASATASTSSSSDRSVKQAEEKSRLNTLGQIFEHDDDSDSGIDCDHDCGNDSDGEERRHDNIISRPSSNGLDRITGEDDLWCYTSQGEDPMKPSWLGRLRERWSRSSSHHPLHY